MVGRLDKYDPFNKPKAPTPALPLTAAPPPPAAPAPPPRREIGPLPTLQKTAVEAVKLDRTGVDQQFDLNREKAAKVEGTALQGQRDAIARRAAQMGGGPGGAMLKIEQQAGDVSAERLQGANREIDAAKDAEYRRMNELETQLTVAKEESQAARDMDTWKTNLSTAVTKYGIDVDQDFKDASLALDKWAKEETIAMGKDENKINAGTAIATLVGNLKTIGYTPEQIDGILKGIDLEGFGIDLSNTGGVTKRPPMVMPASSSMGDQVKAFNENKKNGYSSDEMQQTGNFKVR